MLKALTKAGFRRLKGDQLARVTSGVFAHLAPRERERCLRDLLARIPESERDQLLLACLRGLGTKPRIEIVAELTRELSHASDPEEAFLVAERLQGYLSENQASLDHLLDVYANYARRLTKAGAELEGARILELGPGHSLLGGLLFVVWGAAAYCGADPFPTARLDAARVEALLARLEKPTGLPVHLESVADQQRALVERARGLIVRREGEVRLDERIWLVPDDAAALSAEDESFDLVVSNSVLEHVRDFPSAARECLRVLRPGGLALHYIDLRDHRDFDAPRAFLRYSHSEWESQLQGTPFDYTNRLRRASLRAGFLSAGLEVLEEEIFQRVPLASGERAGLSPEFRDLPSEELEILGVGYVLRKP